MVTNLRDTLATVQQKFGSEAIEDIIPQVIAISSSYNRLSSSIDAIEAELKSTNEQLTSIRSTLDTERRLRQSAEATAVEWEEQVHEARICAKFETDNLGFEVRDLEREIHRLRAELESRLDLEKIMKEQAETIESLEITTAKQAEDLDLMVGKTNLYDSNDSWDVHVDPTTDAPTKPTSPIVGISDSVRSILNKSVPLVTSNITLDDQAELLPESTDCNSQINSLTNSSTALQSQANGKDSQFLWSEGIQKLLDSAGQLNTEPGPLGHPQDLSFGDITLLDATEQGHDPYNRNLLETIPSEGHESSLNSPTSGTSSQETSDTNLDHGRPNRHSLAFEISNIPMTSGSQANGQSSSNLSGDPESKRLSSVALTEPRSHCRVGIRHLSVTDSSHYGVYPSNYLDQPKHIINNVSQNPVRICI